MTTTQQRAKALLRKAHGLEIIGSMVRIYTFNGEPDVTLHKRQYEELRTRR